MNSFLKTKLIFLSMSLLFVIASIAAIEHSPPKEKFEALRDRILHDFHGDLARSKLKELGLDSNKKQEGEDSQGQKLEQEAAEANTREEEKRLAGIERLRQKIERQAKRLEEGIEAEEAQQKLKDDLISLRNQLEESRKKVEAEEIKRQTFETQARQYIENLKRQLEESQKKLVAEEIKKQTSEIEKKQAALQAKQNIENLKKQLEATQKKVHELKSQIQLAQQWEVEAEQQRRIQAEEQRIKQETEQRKKQEKIALWCSGMDITIQHVEYLKNYNITYGELWKALEKMKTYYLEEIHRLNSRSNGETFGNSDDITGQIRTLWDPDRQAHELIKEAIFYIQEYNGCKKRFGSIGWTKDSSRGKLAVILSTLKNLLNKKMEKYEELQGHIHPLRDEVSRL